MKSRVRFIFLFIIIFLVVSCAPAIKNLDSKGENIICFGNSITKGIGAKKDETYPVVLEKILKREVINAGVSADTTSSALKRLERDVLNKTPFLVIIELGGNDFLQKVPKKETLKNLEEIIIRIQEKGAVVALCDISCGLTLSGYRGDFRKLAKKTGSILVPRLLDNILDSSAHRFDYIHPNKKGYSLIAQRVYKAIIPYME